MSFDHCFTFYKCVLSLCWSIDVARPSKKEIFRKVSNFETKIWRHFSGRYKTRVLTYLQIVQCRSAPGSVKNPFYQPLHFFIAFLGFLGENKKIFLASLIWIWIWRVLFLHCSKTHIEHFSNCRQIETFFILNFEMKPFW